MLRSVVSTPRQLRSAGIRKHGVVLRQAKRSIQSTTRPTSSPSRQRLYLLSSIGLTVLLGATASPWGSSAFVTFARNDAPASGEWSRQALRARKPGDRFKAAQGGDFTKTGAGQQAPPSQVEATARNLSTSEEEVEANTAWQSVASKMVAAKDSVTSVEWSAIPDKMVDLVIPEWIQVLPGFITKLQKEMSAAPGTLADEIWNEAHDAEINPEIMWDASVRVSNDLCNGEKQFLKMRKDYTVKALAKYLGIPEKDVHPDDVPVIAMCGSGGGLRALVAGSSSYLSAKEAGLFDCITYTAGVSGSCWLQTLYYSSIAGQSHAKLIRHLKSRLGVHIAYPPAALSLLNSAPTNKYLLSGIVEKLRGVPNPDFGIVDIYGLLLGARLLVPKGELSVDSMDLKISNQRRYTDTGAYPMPIYTAVRHEIPIQEQAEEDPVSAVVKAKKEAWFQWFEFTPYEFWCEELEAGIPIWAIGRKFDHGRTVWRENGLALPELRVPLMMGIWGSAFCATLSHYYKEVQPLLKGLAGFASIDSLIAERDEELIKVHPIDPATVPNYAYGMRDQLPSTCPESIHSTENLQLMDAGMSNNLPIYPLLRPGRGVDVLIAFDASADVRTDNWLRVADGYARQRGIRGWPLGSGWPSPEASTAETAKQLDAAENVSAEVASQKVTEAKEEQRIDEAKSGQTYQQKVRKGDLGYCTVWVGTTEERRSEEEPPESKAVEEDWQLMAPNAGIAVVYFPFIPNPKVEGVDPNTSDFMSTWNFVYTPEQIDKVVALARANFEEGKDQTKRTVRAVYERKKAIRLKKEAAERDLRQRWKMRRGLLGKHAHGDEGDHFS